VPPTTAPQPGLPTDYYAPDYQIEVEGQDLDPETRGDVLDLKVVMSLEDLTSFDLSVNNWDDRHVDFKYSDTKAFDVGNRVHVRMGYAGRLLSMVRGQIVTLTPQFPESGSPTLGVSGLDAMVRLRDSKPDDGETKKYVGMADWEIAQAVAGRNGLESQVTREGPRHDLVVQKNQDDAQFLMERAKRIDFDCYVQTDADTGRDTLFFVKPSDARDASRAKVYVFEWGRSLISFSPQLTLSRQVSQLTVRGWNSRTKEVFTYTADAADLPGGGEGTSGPAAVGQTMGEKREVVVDAPVTSEQEARDLAVSLLRERAYEFITGSGQVIGLPDLRPGQNVELQGLGRRFSGLYYVTQVEHSLGSSGYLTSFEVRRTHDGGVEG
jgi:phage protein D